MDGSVKVFRHKAIMDTDLEHKEHEDQDKGDLHHHHHELGDHVGQHHLEAGHPGDPGPVQQPLLPLDDEADGGKTHRHEVSDAEDHAGSHELGEGGLIASIHRGLKLHIAHCQDILPNVNQM